MKNVKILAPTDFSDLSMKAMETAGDMAELFDGKVTPFHAYIPITELDGPYTIGLGPNLNENYDQIEDALLERLEDDSNQVMDSDLLDDPVIAVGNPAQCVIDASEEYDLVCMSTHGRTGFTRVLLGSVAEKVLRLAHTPVLIVEEGSIVKPMKRILVTTDLSDNSFAAFQYANDVAEATGAQVDLLHIISLEHFEDNSTASTVVTIREERLKVLAKEYFSDLGENVQPEVILASEAPHETILNLTKDRDYNLVVMSTVGRTGLDYLMMGSTTANVVRHVETAVLSVNPKRTDGE